MIKSMEHGFVVDRAKPRVTFPLTARELEEVDDLKAGLSVKHLSSSTVRVPVRVPPLDDLVSILNAAQPPMSSRTPEDLIIGRLEIHIERGLIKYLKARAAKENKTVSDLIREALKLE